VIGSAAFYFVRFYSVSTPVLLATLAMLTAATVLSGAAVHAPTGSGVAPGPRTKGRPHRPAVGVIVALIVAASMFWWVAVALELLIVSEQPAAY